MCEYVGAVGQVQHTFHGDKKKGGLFQGAP